MCLLLLKASTPAGREHPEVQRGWVGCGSGRNQRTRVNMWTFPYCGFGYSTVVSHLPSRHCPDYIQNALSPIDITDHLGLDASACVHMLDGNTLNSLKF